MATDAPTLPPALNDARRQAGRFWQARAPRERQLIVVMAVSVAVLLVWLTLIQPALRILREAPLELDRLDQARSAARARPMEAQLVKAATGYTGSITVSLGGTS